MPGRLLRLLGALGLALAAGLAAPTLAPAPAEAAGCSGSGGVTVVVDYNGLGGGIEQGCAAGSGGTAYDLFRAVGTQMTEASRERGFVCRVNGVPANDPCVNASPANAYWGLFVSDGSGSWSYASTGARGLRVPDGGMVAWSWQGSPSQTPPSVSARRTAAPESNPQSGGAGGGGRGGNGGGGATAPEAPRDTPSDEPTTTPDDEESTGPDARRDRREERTDRGERAVRRADRDRPRRGAGDRDEDTQQESSRSSLSDADGETRADDVRATGDPSDPDGLPLWVPLVVVGLLGAGGVGAALWRRRTTGSA